MRTTVILGAGFSKNSGLPLQSELPALLVNSVQNEFEASVSEVIKNFMKDVFGFRGGEIYPSLDDMFTCIDIASNAGHHLGIGYSPQKLRSVRKFIVYRVFSILEEHYKYSDEVMGLVNNLHKNSSDLSYIVLNWDTVLERYLRITNSYANIDYCNNGKNVGFRNENSENRLRIMKVHGSCNWLYCDNCRAIINDINNDITKINKAGFTKEDFELFDGYAGFRNMDESANKVKCPMCDDTISSHIASSSYRKSFRENSYPNIWSEAEDELSSSDKWIFIGYSMPQADYEFKHLLKISEIKLKHKKEKKPDIDVVILNSKTTKEKYESLFGDKVNAVYNGGIKEYLNAF